MNLNEDINCIGRVSILSKQGFEEAIEFIRPQYTDLFGANLAGTVNYEGKRQDALPVTELPREFHGFQSPDDQGVVDAHLFGIRLHALFLVDCNADKLHTIRAVTILELDEPGDFLAARRAPCRPEIDHQNLAAPLLEWLQLVVDPHEFGRQQGAPVRLGVGRHVTDTPLIREETGAGKQYGDEVLHDRQPDCERRAGRRFNESRIAATVAHV